MMNAGDRARERRTGSTAKARLVERAFALLFQLGDRRRGVRLAELARGSGLSRATALRILRTLCALDVVSYNDHAKLYRLGPGLGRLHPADSAHDGGERLAASAGAPVWSGPRS